MEKIKPLWELAQGVMRDSRELNPRSGIGAGSYKVPTHALNNNCF